MANVKLALNTTEEWTLVLNPDSQPQHSNAKSVYVILNSEDNIACQMVHVRLALSSRFQQLTVKHAKSLPAPKLSTKMAHVESVRTGITGIKNKRNVFQECATADLE